MTPENARSLKKGDVIKVELPEGMGDFLPCQGVIALKNGEAGTVKGHLVVKVPGKPVIAIAGPTTMLVDVTKTVIAFPNVGRLYFGEEILTQFFKVVSDEPA